MSKDLTRSRTKTCSACSSGFRLRTMEVMVLNRQNDHYTSPTKRILSQLLCLSHPFLHRLCFHHEARTPRSKSVSGSISKSHIDISTYRFLMLHLSYCIYVPIVLLIILLLNAFRSLVFEVNFVSIPPPSDHHSRDQTQENRCANANTHSNTDIAPCVRRLLLA